MTVNQANSSRPYTKIIVYKHRLLRFIIPPAIFLLVTVTGIIVYFASTRNNPPDAQHPESRPFVFGLLDKVFFPKEPSPSTHSSVPANPDNTETPNSNISTPDGFPSDDDPPPNFMESDKETPELFDELDSQIQKMHELDLQTGLIDKLKLNAQAAFEKGEVDSARNTLLWTLQLTREFIQVQAEATLSAHQ